MSTKGSRNVQVSGHQQCTKPLYVLRSKVNSIHPNQTANNNYGSANGDCPDNYIEFPLRSHVIIQFVSRLHRRNPGH